MKLLYTTIAFLFIVQLNAQQADTSGITQDFIYNFMNNVVKHDGLLNSKYSISSTADFYMLEDELTRLINDTNKPIAEPIDSFLVSPEDSVIITNDSGKTYYLRIPPYYLTNTISLPFKRHYNTISLGDKKYMLDQINTNQSFVWDKKRLGMVKKDTKYHYSVSPPLFSRDKKQALLLVRMLCPGLCGTGHIYLYTQTGNVWSYKTVSMWMH